MVGYSGDLRWGTGSGSTSFIRYRFLLPGTPNIEQILMALRAARIASWLLEVRLSATFAAALLPKVWWAVAPLAVEGVGTHCRLNGGGKVCHLGVHLVVDVLVGGFHVVSAVVSRSLGAALNELVQVADLNVVVAEERDEVVESVVDRARAKLHHLTLKIRFLLNFRIPLHHQLRLTGGRGGTELFKMGLSQK